MLPRSPYCEARTRHSLSQHTASSTSVSQGFMVTGASMGCRLAAQICHGRQTAHADRLRSRVRIRVGVTSVGARVSLSVIAAHHDSGRRGEAHGAGARNDERSDAEVEGEDEMIAVAGYPSSWEATRQTCRQRELFFARCHGLQGSTRCDCLCVRQFVRKLRDFA